MSTAYASQAYIFAQIEETISSDLTVQQDYIGILENIFTEAGWNVERVPTRIRLLTEPSGGFPISILGISNWVFYTVATTTSTIFVPDDSIDDIGACSGWASSCSCSGQSLNNHRGQAYGPTDSSGGASRHNHLMTGAKYALHLDGFTTYNGPTTQDVDDNYITDIYFDGWYTGGNIGLGNQHPGEVTLTRGGLLVTCQDAITNGNSFSLYIRFGVDGTLQAYWSVSGAFPSFSMTPNLASQVDTDYFCPSFEFTHYPATLTGTHPQDYIDENPDDVQPFSWQEGQRYHYFANPHTICIDVRLEDQTGASNNMFASALKLKPLEGEVLESDPGYPDDMNIQKSVIIMDHGPGFSLQRRNQPTCAISFTDFRGNGFSSQNESTGQDDWGPFILNSMGATEDYTDYPDGIEWNGGIAEIGEAWVASNFMNPNSVYDAPIVAQLWDACVPYRTILEGTGDSPTPFFWDGQLWRYYQQNKNQDPNGPASSLAFRVNDLGVYDGSTYAGAIRVDLASLDVSPTSIPNGGNVTITVTLSAPAPARGALVILHTPGDERIQFTSHIHTITEGEIELAVTYTTIGLSVEETTRVKAISTNTLSQLITFEA